MTWREMILQTEDEMERAIAVLNFARMVNDKFPHFDIYSKETQRQIRDKMLDKEVENNG